MRIDLHTHSSASDGTDRPAELVRAAARAGLDVVALTDHDTTAGWDEAAAALPTGLRLVRGMEMSCTGRGEDGAPVAVHLLAYLFDPHDPVFVAELERLRGERVSRIRAMGVRMADDGLPIDIDAVLAEAGPAAGRPHLARALVAAGVVPTVADAFTELLSPRGRYYVPKADTPLADAVKMVTAAGGVPVVAHARARARGRLLALDHIEELAELGLGGVEADHPDHDEQDVRTMRDLARSLGVVVTGSSDYHGDNKTIRLGSFTTAPAAYEALLDCATSVEVLEGMRRRGARYPDEEYGSPNDENYYDSEYYNEPYYPDEGYYADPYEPASRRASLPVRALRALSGVVCGAVLVLTFVVCGAQYLAGDRGFPGPGATSVAAHVVAALVAVIAQVTADRRSGGTALLSSLVVIFTASILMITQWWG